MKGLAGLRGAFAGALLAARALGSSAHADEAAKGNG